MAGTSLRIFARAACRWVSFAGTLAAFPAGLLAQEEAMLGWKAAARMQAARYDHCVAGMEGGMALVAGGTSADGPTAGVEIYGPGDEFAQAPPMQRSRAGHSCTVLLDGRILVAGGDIEGTVEIYSPPTSSWTLLPNSAAVPAGHSATLLPGGRVVLAGGRTGDQLSSDIGIFDPDTNRVTRSAVRMASPRARHAAVALPDGRVLFIGGTDGTQSLKWSEIYDPVTDTIAAAAPLSLPRAGHSAVVLGDGRVLVAGGNDGSADLGNAELYHPGADWFEWVAAPMITPRSDAFATLIPGVGAVLIAGGENSGNALAATEVFQPLDNRFVPAGALTAARTRIRGAALEDGIIFATGGRNANGAFAGCGLLGQPSLTLQGSTSFSVSSPGTSLSDGSVRTITPTVTVFNPGQSVVALGSRFLANSTVTLALRLADGTSINNRLLAASTAANSAGTFNISAVTLNSGDVGKRMTLRATGAAQPAIQDGTSNTIIVGEGAAPISAEASFSVKSAVTISATPLVQTVLTGSTIPVRVQLTPATPVGPISGTVSITLGFVTQQFSVSGVAPGSTVDFNFCCVTTPGVYTPGASYSGDANYAAAQTPIVFFSTTPNTVNVVANQVSLSLSAAGFPLFTSVAASLSAAAPAAGFPVPTGTINVSRPGLSTFNPLTLALTRDLRSLSIPTARAGFDFKAGFLDKPSACFVLSYSGDAVYAASTSPSICVPVTPAQPLLTITGPETYTFGSPVPMLVRMSFPPELGVVNRLVHLNPPGTDLSMSIQVGSAIAATRLLFAFNERGIEAVYSGGGDLASARGFLALKMLPVATETKLDPISSPTKNPITLKAFVKTTVPLTKDPTGKIVTPAGTVQFFDGTLALGSVTVTANADNSVQAVLPNVARPVGKRELRAVYSGDALFAGSTSDTLTVTIQ